MKPNKAYCYVVISLMIAYAGVIWAPTAAAGESKDIDARAYENYGILIIKSDKPNHEGLYYLRLKIPQSLDGNSILSHSIEIVSGNNRLLSAPLFCQPSTESDFDFCELNASLEQLRNLQLMLLYKSKDGKETYGSYHIFGKDWIN